MSRVPFSPDRVRLIAGNTLREAARQRLLQLFLLLGLGFVLGAQHLRDFNFGASELKFIADFGLGALTIFGSALSITATASLFWSELEQRTAHTLLAKPVWRLEFILGKFLGVAAVVAAFCALLTGLLMAVLWAREAALLRELHEPVRGSFTYAGVAAAGFSQLLKLSVLAAFTLLLASFAQSQLFTVVMGFFVLVICHLQFMLQEAYQRSGTVVARAFAGLLAFAFPDFQAFAAADWSSAASGPDAMTLLRLTAYAGGYVAVLCGLASWLFHRREI